MSRSSSFWKSNVEGPSLFRAILVNDVEQAKHALKIGAPPNTRYKHGNTALHFAVIYNHIEIVKVLIPAVQNVDERNDQGETPLHIAVIHGFYDIAELLLSNNADLNIPFEPKGSLIHFIVENGDTRLLHLLLSKKPDLTIQNTRGQTPLLVSLEKADPTIASILLANGASPDCKDKMGNTTLHYVLKYFVTQSETKYQLLETFLKAKLKCINDRNEEETVLHIAVSQIDLRAISILAKYGADVNAKDVRQDTCLHIAARNGQWQVLNTLLTDFPVKINEKNEKGYTALLCAVSADHVECAQLLISAGANVHEKEESGMSALYLAIQNSNVGLLSVLLEHGISVDTVNNKKETPLLFSVKNLQAECLAMLLKGGASVFCADKDNNTPFHIAAKLKSPAIMFMLLKGQEPEDRRPSITSLFSRVLSKLEVSLNQLDSSGLTALHYAVANNDIELTRMLVCYGADVDVFDYYNNTCLHYAAKRGFIDPIKFLLNAKAKVDGINSEGKSALSCALEMGFVECARALIVKGASVQIVDDAGNSPLHVAVQLKDSGLIQMLLERKPNLNLKNKNTMTPLLICANDNYFEGFQLLVDAGANINNSNGNRDTSLNISASKGFKEILTLLISNKKIELEKANNMNKTPLFSSLEHSQYECCKLLLEAKANVNRPDNTGITPIHLAIEQNQQELLELMIKKGGNIEALKKETHETPLLFAVKNSNLSCISILLQNGASINCFDSDKNSPLHIVSKLGNVAVITLLLSVQNLKCINDKNNEGLTALMIATYLEHLQVVKLLVAGEKMVRKCLEIADADVNCKEDKTKNTPFHVAASKGRADILELLLSSSNKYIESKNLAGNTPLNVALETASIECAKLLIQAGSDLNNPDSEGLYPVQIALRSQNNELLRLMLEKGASVNEVIKTTGETPLLYAVNNQFEETVSLLLQHGAHVDQKDHYQDTPLHIASQKGNVKILQSLLDKNPHCLNDMNRFSMTALASAVVHNHVPCVEVLVAAGADVNAKDDRNFSPIMIAAKNGYFDSLLALLVPSAKLNERSDDGYTALNEALLNDHTDCAKLLITKGANVTVADIDGVTPLHLSCHKASTLLVKTLLRKGAKVEEVDGLGQTPLLVATNAYIASTAEEAHLECIQYLLEANANVNVTDRNKNTVLHLAAASGKDKLVKLLLETKGTKLDEKNSELKTPLHLAFDNIHYEIAKLLLNSDANPNTSDIFGVTPVHLAVEHGWADLLDTMLKRGAALDAVRKDSHETPLLAAIRTVHQDCVDLLLSLGASISVNDKSGNTPCHVAAKIQNPAIMELVLGKLKPAKIINAYNHKGFTPLLIAVENNFLDGTSMLIKIADINIADKSHNYTAVSIAARWGYLDILKLLIEAKANINEESAYEESPLLLALQNEKEECAIALLEAGASIDCIDEKGNSLLFYAARLGYDRVVELLVASNRTRSKLADTTAVDRDFVNEQNNNWERPLILAAKQNHLNIVKMLIGTNKTCFIVCVNINKELGAIVDVCDSYGDSCYHWAIKNDNLDMIISLLTRNSSAADARNKAGETPLMYAANLNKMEFVRLLVQFNVSLEYTDHQEMTLLHVACKNGNKELMQLVMSNKKKKVSLDCTDRQGRTPLMYVAKYKSPNQSEFAELLLSSSAHVNLKDGYGRTALHYAAEDGNCELIELFLKYKANVLIEDIDGNKPHELAKKNNQLNAKRLIRNYYTILHEQPPVWQQDRVVVRCMECLKQFNLFVRRHHCRHCGGIFCDDCTNFRCAITKFNLKKPVRVCRRCYYFLQKTLNKPAEEVNKINRIAKTQQINTETTWVPYPDEEDEEDKSTGSPPPEFFENEHYRQWKLAVMAEEPNSSPEGSPLPTLRRRSSSQDISTKEELYLDNNSRSL